MCFCVYAYTIYLLFILYISCIFINILLTFININNPQNQIYPQHHKVKALEESNSERKSDVSWILSLPYDIYIIITILYIYESILLVFLMQYSYLTTPDCYRCY